MNPVSTYSRIVINVLNVLNAPYFTALVTVLLLMLMFAIGSLTYTGFFFTAGGVQSADR